MVAEVIINTIAKELNKTYDYIIPDSILNQIKIGSRVFVPFGRAKQKEGFVIGIKKESEFANKEIIKLEDNILTKENVELAKLMSRRYFCNISDCIKLMLPPGATSTNIENRVKDKTESFVYLKKDIDEIEFDIETKKIKSEKQIKLLRFLFENEGIHVLDLSADACARHRSRTNTNSRNRADVLPAYKHPRPEHGLLHIFRDVLGHWESGSRHAVSRYKHSYIRLG